MNPFISLPHRIDSVYGCVLLVNSNVFLPNRTPKIDQTVQTLPLGPTFSSFAYREPVAQNRTPNQWDVPVVLLCLLA